MGAQNNLVCTQNVEALLTLPLSGKLPYIYISLKVVLLAAGCHNGTISVMTCLANCHSCYNIFAYFCTTWHTCMLLFPPVYFQYVVIFYPEGPVAYWHITKSVWCASTVLGTACKVQKHNVLRTQMMCPDLDWQAPALNGVLCMEKAERELWGLSKVAALPATLG